MKREEHYCDRCGIQMTFQSYDGDSDWSGVRLKFKTDNTTCEVSDMAVYLSKQNGCGTSGKAESLYGREFCSQLCFESAVSDWIERMKGFWK